MELQLSEIETPALVVDLDRLERNLDRAADYSSRHSLRLRPHVKTHKSSRVAAEQMKRGAAGLTCATPFETEVMAEGLGRRLSLDRRGDPRESMDVLLAYPPVGARRAARIASLPQHVAPTVALDSVTALGQISAAAAEARREIGVLVEIDLGMHRVGVQDIDSAISLARAVADDRWLRYAGIAFYPGHIRSPVEDQDDDLAALGGALAAAIERLSAAGYAPGTVSGGSTPTLWRSHEITGVNEIRPGTYVFNDRTTAQIGACGWDDCALSILATVVSTAVSGQAVIDAGTKALGREPMRGAAGEGFAALLDRPEVVVKGMSEEHGLLDLSATSWRPRVGDVVRVVPNHVCIVVHLADELFGVRDDAVVDRWPVEARGR